MSTMTTANLKSAFGGESMAHMRYISWGEFAIKEGFPNVGNLFFATSYAEQVHAQNHFRELKDAVGDADVTAGAGFGLTTTSENLQGAINGEKHEVEQMYPAFIAVAELQGDKGALRSFNYAVEAEKTHIQLFTDAKNAVDSGKDYDQDTIHVCTVCGHTLAGDLTDPCPVCKVGVNMFRTFVTESK